jgi:hypothetical protein
MTTNYTLDRNKAIYRRYIQQVLGGRDRMMRGPCPNVERHGQN